MELLLGLALIIGVACYIRFVAKPGHKSRGPGTTSDNYTRYHE